MKAKKYLPAFIAGLILIGVLGFGWFASANSSRQVGGVLRMEIIEPNDEIPMQTRYFVQYWDGDNFRHIYLVDENGIDLDSYINKEVLVTGNGGDNYFVVKEMRVEKKTGQQQVSVLDNPADTRPEAVIAPFTVPQVTQGSRTALFMLAHHGQTPTTTYTLEQIKRWGMTDLMSANMFFKNSSFGKLWLTGVNNPDGDVTPWLRLTATTDDCLQGIGNAWRIEADNLAEAQGYSKTAYKFRVLLYAPIPNCDLTAGAQVGTFGDPSGVVYVFMQLPSSGLDSDLTYYLRTLVHELEHCMGQAQHSNGQQTENGPILLQRDNADSLGSGMIMNHLINRIKFGWIGNSQTYPVLQTRGRHRFLIQTPTKPSKGIGPNSPPIGGLVELRNMDGTLSDKIMVLETRTMVSPYDMFASDVQAYVGGVTIRFVGKNLESSGTGTVLLDSTPETSCCKDAPLRPGRTFTVNSYGVTITAEASILNRVWVTVDLGQNYPL